MSDVVRKVSDVVTKVSDGVRKVSYGIRKVSHGAGKVSHGARKVSHGSGRGHTKECIPLCFQVRLVCTLSLSVSLACSEGWQHSSKQQAASGHHSSLESRKNIFSF